MDRTERLLQDGVDDYILFYRPLDAWGVFSQFSRHPLLLPSPWTRELTMYATGEHRFQAMKAANHEHHDWVVEAASASDAKQRGRQVGMIDGWERADHRGIAYLAMFEVCIAKTFQHDEVQDAVIRSEGRHIYEDSPTDDIWGWRFRADHRGKNLLGRAWMDTRGVLGLR